jgi:ribonuclease G
VTRSKKGAPGEEPAAAPAASEGAASEATRTPESGGETQPKRRRGSRGGRRHKKPAAVQTETAAAPADDVRPQTSSPRDGYASASGGLSDLPTAPLIPAAGEPVGAGRPRPPVADASPEVAAPKRRSRSRATRPAAAPAEVESADALREAGAQPPPAAKPRRQRPSRSASNDEATKSVTTPVVEAAAEAQPEQGSGTETPAGDGVEPHARRRRRGNRGGRHRRKAADIEHEEATREAEEAAGEPETAAEAHALDAQAAKAAKAGEQAKTAKATRGGDDGKTAEVAPEAAEAAADEDGGEAATKRRRRGARGGKRARGKRTGEVAAEAEGEAGATAAEAEETAAPAAKSEPAPAGKAPAKSRRQREQHRRPKAIVRQDEGSGLGTVPSDSGQRRPAVVVERPDRKIILVTDDGEELRVALVEDGRLSEIYIERPDRKSYLGDIYQGKVENVMSGIDAAFVDFGLEKNGFLYVDEVTTPEGEKRARRISDALKNGQQVLVQVIKDPMGHKGARLSTKISLAGRYLVYVPGGSGVGVSRRLKQGERERLRDISKELKPKNAGLIIRTIAEGHGFEDLKRDMQYLSRLWTRLKKKAETVKPPGLVHKEVDISLEVTRDLFNQTCESLIVDDAKRHKAIISFLKKEAPELLPKVHLHTGDEPLFQAYGIEEQISRALERRVPLPSGGNLMIDHAEALTVIDVNTGRFTRGKGLEDTITKTNIEAAKEVVRQLRLRDIGGIIIIDFIDMAHAKNRELVLATLEAELETDRTKTYVVELSPLGLVEMTRQNTTDGARGIMTRACPTCSGKGRVLSEETMALSVERRVRALARKSQAKAWLIEVNGAVAERLAGARLKRLEKQIGRRVFLEGGSALPVDSFRVISEGSLEHVQEQRVPVREGQEVTVELEFSLTYSPRDAVGYVDGYMVIVEGGRQHLGKRRRVRITEIARTGARATVLKKDVKGDKATKEDKIAKDEKDAN